ncbi:NAD(P)-binding domain-containing protein [Amnibacterium kyonggiense]|uniref:Putative amino acid dehydrogenase n=1 Tax=Amnibacterium kyonggiense TaxID=595671 RepID=A0A4R7FKP5_9MICO|nr:NAD(P)-binding domain-containing protein [Amnibacterium kyonggiense]TDS76940.1 putative amino acid dehydrogenase [Amnibacterium kyonggiense]
MDTTPAPRGRFAFLIHPRTDPSEDLALINPVLGLIPGRVVEKAMRKLPLKPWVHSTITAADRPDEVLGDVIALPLTPTMLLGDDRALIARRVDQAIDLAVARGATVLGLGALTAPATAGGAKLRRRTDIGVTNGNAYTAAATAAAVERIAAGMTKPPVVALVGANGSVGTAVARVLGATGVAEELVLVGRTPAALAALAGDLGATWSTEMTACRRADVVVLMTSAVGAVLTADHLKLGAVVLDDTQPRNSSPALASERPDVTILDGGVVATPGLVRTGHGIGLPATSSFACLAESSLLALADHRGHGTIGRPSLEQVARVRELSERFGHLGFGLAEPTSFGEPVTVRGWTGPARREAPATIPDGAVA